MDFLEGLTLSKGKSTVLVVLDMLTKHGHILALAHLYTVATMAQVYLEQV